MAYVEGNYPPKPLMELMLAPESPLLKEQLSVKTAEVSDVVCVTSKPFTHCMSVSVCVCTRARIYIYISVCVCVCGSVCLCVCVFVLGLWPCSSL